MKEDLTKKWQKTGLLTSFSEKEKEYLSCCLENTANYLLQKQNNTFVDTTPMQGDLSCFVSATLMANSKLMKLADEKKFLLHAMSLPITLIPNFPDEVAYCKSFPITKFRKTFNHEDFKKDPETLYTEALADSIYEECKMQIDDKLNLVSAKQILSVGMYKTICAADPELYEGKIRRYYFTRLSLKILDKD